MARSEDYQITQADIITADGATVDVRASIMELVIFEDIRKAFLTGSVLIVDTSNFMNQIKFTGTEKLIVEVSSGDLQITTRTKTFIMTCIDRAEKTNDYTTVFSFSLLEEYAFASRITKISQAFSGMPLDIINVILSQLQQGLALDKTLMGSEPIQQSMRVITPYITPLQAVEWIRDRATTAEGFPFFLYGSLKTDGVYVNSLANILKKTPWNTQPFVYSQAATNTDMASQENIYYMSKYDPGKTDDTLTATMNGAVSARWQTLDLLYQRFNSPRAQNFGIEKVLPNNTVFNTDFVINNKPLNEYVPKAFFHVVSSNLYSDNIGNYHVGESLDQLTSKITNKGLRNAMFKNEASLELQGISFLASADATVGSTININILGVERDQAVDEKKSGPHIIVGLRHSFANGRHDVGARVTKMTNRLQYSSPENN
jgi:hypothetical protein